MTTIENVADRDTLLARLDLTRRVVDAVNDHAVVESVKIEGHQVGLHLLDPTKADRVATLYALSDVKDFGGRHAFTTYEGSIDEVDFVVYGAPRNDRSAG
jgi:hypothetical protein